MFFLMLNNEYFTTKEHNDKVLNIKTFCTLVNYISFYRFF